jgi:hypothetical protein
MCSHARVTSRAISAHWRRASSGAARRRALRAVTFAVLVVLAPGVGARESGPLVRLLAQGPWSAVSGLVGYRERLWFVNSEKFVNHNSADLYSYHPATGEARYEHHLFSQDAGDPAVVAGLLFWPFEDSRFSTGRGEFALTDGRDWRWSWLPEQQVFHLHAATAVDGTVYVATSAWRAGLQRSADLGATWEVLYDHPTPARRVSRFTALAALDGAVFAGLTSHTQPGAKLFRFQAGVTVPVRSWPEGESTRGLVGHRGWLYAVNHAGGKRTVLRTNGQRVEPLEGLAGLDVRGFAAGGGQRIWAIAAERDAGALLASDDGTEWTFVQRLPDAEPVAVALYAGQVYVGAIGPGARGSLWGPAPGAPVERLPAPAGPVERAPPLPRLPLRAAGGDLAAELAALDAALAPVEDSADRRVRLERALTPLIRRGTPAAGRALSERLARSYPPLEVARFGGRVRVTLGRSNRWHLLRAIALTGHGRVPPALLAEPWVQQPNAAEKYFEPLPAAAWAIARIGQDDRETLDALVERLGDPDLPPWANGDLVGALTALSGRRFAYDLDAWRAWWGVRRQALR